MTVEEFRKKPAYYRRLAEIIADPVFKAATEIIAGLARPRIVKGGTTDGYAHQALYAAGVNSVIEAYERLATKVPDKEKEELPNEFDGYMGGRLLTPEELEEKTKELVRNKSPK